MDEALGERLQSALAGRYQIERELGRGGMAVVFLAADLKLARPVALKVLRPELTLALGAERFQREIAIAARLHHPHILGLHDSGEAAGMLYYAMPFVAGETLRARLRREVQLNVVEAVQLACEVAGALEHAHRAGVVHRDIKPENILLADGHALVADFGIARALDAADGPHLTETGLSLGTPSYMSPEQATGGRTVDGRSDQYALGCMLYEMLAGVPPFTGPTAQTILARHALDPVPCLRTVRSTVSPELESAIGRALAKVPADRFASVARFRDALEGALRPHHAEQAVTVSTAARPAIARPHALVLGLGIAAALAMSTVLIGVRGRHPASGSAAEAGARSAGGPAFRSLAVAPFTNLTGDTSQIYLSEGFTDELVTSLAQIKSLRVIPLKRDQAAPSSKELAQRLGINVVLTGSLQRAGDSVRVAIQLRSTAGDQTLWAHAYDGALRTILGLQDEVARSVVEQVQGTLTPNDRIRMTAGHPNVTPAAYDAYVRGTYFLGKVTEVDFRRAIGYFQQAIDVDPVYAGAYAGLAECYSELGYYGLGSPSETFPKARAAALKALELDSTVADAYSTLAKVEFLYTWDFASAERAFQHAGQLNPGSSRFFFLYGFFLAGMGRRAESIAYAKRSVEADPLSLIVSAAAARPYYNARRYPEAIGQSQRTLAMDSTFSRAHFWLGLSYEQAGRLADAVHELQRTVDQAGRIPVYVAALGHAYAVAGRRADAVKVAEELEQQARLTYISPVDIATVYAGLGQTDDMFAWLEQGFEGRAYGLVFLNVDPRFDAVRSDPRFVDLVRRVGLPPVAVTSRAS